MRHFQIGDTVSYEVVHPYDSSITSSVTGVIHGIAFEPVARGDTPAGIIYHIVRSSQNIYRPAHQVTLFSPKESPEPEKPKATYRRYEADAKPEPKFKVGDRIYYTKGGHEGRITSVGEGRNGMMFYDAVDDRGLIFRVPFDDAELIKAVSPKPDLKFKVGDRVIYDGMTCTIEKVGYTFVGHACVVSVDDPLLSPAPAKSRRYLGSYPRSDGHYSLIFEANSQADAEAHCAALGMVYDGVIA